jgi:UDP-N-acetylmuramoyl-L-alanyl-D-glutamate--2,6-diaminopimelate ligase
MRLDHLLDGVDVLEMVNVFGDTEISFITNSSREVAPGCIFVAIPGAKVDGHDFISIATENGATLVIHSRALEPGSVGSFVRVKDTRAVYAELCAKLAGYPSQDLRVIGVTGTNGKTSTTLIIKHLLEHAGFRPAVLGTLGLLKPGSDEFVERGLTTPDAGHLQRMLRELVDGGATHLLMEVSSHALVQHRVDGISFTGGVFTNLTQDHFDYHGTARAYMEAKALLFTRYLAHSAGYAVLNFDDPTGREYGAMFGGSKVTYGSTRDCNLVMENLRLHPDGLDWELVIKNGVWPPELRKGVNQLELSVPLAGRFNAQNCLGAIGVVLLEGLTAEQVRAGLATFPGVPGRLQRVPDTAGVRVYVDYAHTPDALLNVLSTLQETKTEQARIITVFGCGGDRDRDKRPKMAAAAQQLSDCVVVTSDNPRSEDPQHIIADVLTGITPGQGRAEREPDRHRAIHLALSLAQEGDIVLVAGKGHEDYQIFADRTIHFSDVEEVRAYYADHQVRA